jgi:type III pantothenate kinase
LGEVDRVSNADQTGWEAAIGRAWSRLAGSDVAIVAASVNPPLDKALSDLVDRVTGRRVLWVGKDIDLPISVLTEEPDKTGVDRVLTIAAAYEQIEKACVVVDAGTAITIDCCNDNGDFLGGTISPGVSMMLDALHEKTALLPRVEFETPTGVFGKTTRDAILEGVYHGARGMVKDVVEAYATELGQWPDIIATGGDAPKLFKDWELIHAISPDLTLYGIALAYVEHHIHHDNQP